MGETFSITVPLYVVLMSILGGARHWLGPAVGATIIGSSLYAFTSGDLAVLGRALVAFLLILVILLLPEGVVPTLLRRWSTWRHRSLAGTAASPATMIIGDTGLAPAAVGAEPGTPLMAGGRPGGLADVNRPTTFTADRELTTGPDTARPHAAGLADVAPPPALAGEAGIVTEPRAATADPRPHAPESHAPGARGRRLPTEKSLGQPGTAHPSAGGPMDRAHPPTLARETGKAGPDDPAAAVLVCHDVWKAFGGIQALRGVSVEVRPGEIVGLVGPNGSGKTTLINVVSGHYGLDRGRIELGDMTLSSRPAHAVRRLGVSRTYQIPRPFADLTALDNVAVAATFGVAQLTPAAARTEARRWLDFAGLGRRAEALPRELNLHERKFLELARALAARPRVILLDEVLSGLNPSEIAGAVRLIRDIRARGVAILFVEHLMRAVLELSDRVVVLNEGEVIAAGPPHEAMRSARVVEVYLGKAHVVA